MNKKALIFLAVIPLLICGCATQRVWTYHAEPHAMGGTSLVPKKVAVLPLLDSRENTNHNYALLYLIPLMPFGWQDMNTPEGVQIHMTSGLWLFRPSEDFSKAIAEEMNNSGIFKEAFFTYKASEGDLVMRGELLSTHYNGKLISYCLSIYGPLLWFIGFPSCTVDSEVEILLKLEDPATNQVLWEKKYKREYSKLGIGIYYLPPDFTYDTMLKDIMKEAVDSIRKNPVIANP